MKNKTSTSLLVGLLASSLLVTPCYASATQKKLSAAQNSQQESQKQLNDTQGRINSLESKKGNLEGYLTELNKQLRELGENLKVIQTQSEEKQKEMEILQKDLAAAQEIEEEQYASMRLRIQYMYENADNSVMVMFLESKTFSDFLSQAENMSQMTKYDRKMLQEYKKVVAEIQEKEEHIKEEQKKLDELKQESLNKQDEISSVMKATNVQIASYEQQISAEQGNVNRLLSQIESQKNTIDGLIKQQKDEEAAAALAARQQAVNPPVSNTSPAEQQQTPPAQSESAPAPETPEPTPEPDNAEQSSGSQSSQGRYLGKFRITAYCNGPCCGGHSSGLTASGTMPAQGRTVAMGGVPFGTKLSINGAVYTVEDRGTPYGHVDIFYNSHEAAMQFGSTYMDVYQVN